MVTIEFFQAGLFGPAQCFAHPFGYPLRQFARITEVIMPTRAADHHIVEVHRPFIGAEMFDGLAAQFGRQNSADTLGFRLFQ